MKTSSVTLVFVLALGIGFPGLVSAQESGWSMPNLNPFAARSSAPTSTRVADSNSSGWKLPSMWPSSSAARKPAGPSAWQRMRTSTKKAWNQTADFLNPFNDGADNQSTTPITGSNTYFSQSQRQTGGMSASKEKTSFFPPLWSTEEPEQKPKSVVEFLKQPRPQ
ncbi:MAG: hypothetical protein MUF06_09515 [Pirellulaceae bacterium]|nr:hypothetical protein [Pirellulaceae bacterium]